MGLSRFDKASIAPWVALKGEFLTHPIDKLLLTYNIEQQSKLVGRMHMYIDNIEVCE